MKSFTTAKPVSPSERPMPPNVDKRNAMSRVDEAAVTLTIPSDPAYVRLVRLVAASTASDLGYSYEAVEDLRIAADEAANLAISASRAGGSVRIGISGVDHAMAVAMECTTDQTDADFDPLASQIVAALTTSCEVTIVDGELRIFFRCPPVAR